MPSASLQSWRGGEPHVCMNAVCTLLIMAGVGGRGSTCTSNQPAVSYSRLKFRDGIAIWHATRTHQYIIWCVQDAQARQASHQRGEPCADALLRPRDTSQVQYRELCQRGNRPQVFVAKDLLGPQDPSRRRSHEGAAICPHCHHAPESFNLPDNRLHHSMQVGACTEHVLMAACHI
jgi:hypothetical protein